MNKMKTEYLPRCYTLSWDAKNTALIFSIEKTILPFLVKIFTSKAPFLEYLQKLHPVAHSFANIGKAGLPFGFEDQFQFYGEDQETFSYLWKIQPVKKYTGKKCPRCKGKKEDEYGTECFDCHKTGKEVSWVSDSYIESGLKTFHQLTEVISTLFLEYVTGEEEVPISLNKQLIHLEIAANPGYATAYVGGWVDEDILNWIKEVPNRSEKSIINAMMKTSEQLLIFGQRDHSFRFIWNGENFGLEVPGNACDVGTYYGMMNLYSIGRALGCHNTDSSIQQIYFLVGFAVLHDEVLRWLKKK